MKMMQPSIPLKAPRTLHGMCTLPWSGETGQVHLIIVLIVLYIQNDRDDESPVYTQEV